MGRTRVSRAPAGARARRRAGRLAERETRVENQRQRPGIPALSAIIRPTKARSPPGHHSSAPRPPKFRRAGRPCPACPACGGSPGPGFPGGGVEGRVADAEVEGLPLPQEALEDALGEGCSRSSMAPSRPLARTVRPAAARAAGSMSEPRKRQPYSRWPRRDRCSWRPRRCPGPAPARPGGSGRPVGEQVGDVVEVVGPAGDGRAEEAVRQVPGLDAVAVPQQGPVEGPHRGGVGEVDGRVLARVRAHEGRQFRAGPDQSGEVVPAPVPVPGVRPCLASGARLRRCTSRPGSGRCRCSR